MNEALRNENPLSIVPSTDENGHGTMVAGIATEAEFLVVKLKPAKNYLKDFLEFRQMQSVIRKTISWLP
jgi:subtilisin family serine protease